MQTVMRPEIPFSSDIVKKLSLKAKPSGYLQRSSRSFSRPFYHSSDDISVLMAYIKKQYGLDMLRDEVVGLTQEQVAGRIQAYIASQQEVVQA